MATPVNNDSVMHDVHGGQTSEIQEAIKEIQEEYNRNLRLDLKTVLSLLTLISKREELLEHDRELIRGMIDSLTGDLYHSKTEQADVYLTLMLVGGIVGIGGAAFSAHTLGKMAQQVGTSMGMVSNFSNQYYETERMQDESSRQLRYGDHTGAERTRESVQTQLQRILDTLNQLNQMNSQASRMH